MESLSWYISRVAWSDPKRDPKRYSKRYYLTPSLLGFLRTVIAPILRARSDADFKAMRFETEVVELATALLSENQEALTAIKESLLAQISELPLTVNLVARPFTNLHPQGIRGVFPVAEIEEIMALVEERGQQAA